MSRELTGVYPKLAKIECMAQCSANLLLKEAAITSGLFQFRV